MRLVALVFGLFGLLGLFGCAPGGAAPGAAAGRVAKPLSLQASNLPADAAEAVFAAAIRGRRPVAFVYNGVARVALPHRLGASAAGNGKTLVRCWEVRRGDAATGTWKLFEVGKASDPRLLEGTFEPAPGYTPADRAIPAPEIEIPAATQEGTADFGRTQSGTEDTEGHRGGRRAGARRTARMMGRYRF